MYHIKTGFLRMFSSHHVHLNSYGILKIRVQGFRSIHKQEIGIRPLTILAGTNSSGKSSMIQPLLDPEILQGAYAEIHTKEGVHVVKNNTYTGGTHIEKSQIHVAYVACNGVSFSDLLYQWHISSDEKMRRVNKDLEILGIKKISVHIINNNLFSLHIGDINISDVGLGTSQTIPAVVMLQEAQEWQFVYLEHPEAHLHPRAQTAMARILANAAARGVQIVVETHSSLLLLAVQTLVAEGYIPPDLVKLHWSTRDEDGSTHITSADLDETGAFGDWPEDFADVELESQIRYLNTAIRRD